ncbi:MAG: F0F1 ATP synthase subunit delta [Alphaproteobacteria bacterium]|nr:F0F1 ATP synthase subunit delta [Alphaproteobacteria bacterium]
MASDGAGVGGLAARYASALYDLADESGALDAVAADLSGLETLLEDSGDFSRFIKSPVLTRDDQTNGIAAIATKAGLSDITVKFLGLVAGNRRLFALPNMIRAYQDILAARRGQVTAEVTSASELSSGQSQSLADALKAAVGKTVAVTTKVDPSILGGLVVRVGSRMVDSSLKSKLQRLKLSMKGVG